MIATINTCKKYLAAAGLLLVVQLAHAQTAPVTHIIQPVSIKQVEVQDSFWSPKYRVWMQQTAYDVFDKLEGKYNPDREDLIKEKAQRGVTRNALLNFDHVAAGKSNTGSHEGPPWYDGLLYESIRGAADLLVAYPDKKLEEKIDAYIVRIAAAQKASPDGYLNTYTTLMQPTQRWGTNGGNDNWQHDCYNAGMLTEAAVHYYQATGKTALLDVAVKLCNLMCATMGPLPKKNIIPGHGGSEEALLKLYWLSKSDASLGRKLHEKIETQEYYRLATYWIEHRGDHGETTGNTRPDFKAYDQDDKSVFQQTSIEGHAVRATLLATGIAATALENIDPRYINAANVYWNSMLGKKTFITGGQGAIHEEEKFGPDYDLPESAYLETCAAIGGAFFSARMNELMADGKYMDAFERVLYNNMLSGISLSGSRYFYENPLKAKDHQRWEWHSCPCCPPMILKMLGLLPGYIYASDAKNLYVNLFIGSKASAMLGSNRVLLSQSTDYPWKGTSRITVNPAQPGSFTLQVRIPGWAKGDENPFALYSSTKPATPISLKVNGKVVPLNIKNGYASITRTWQKKDLVELELPITPRYITANPAASMLNGKTAIAAGPLVYGLEAIDNPSLEQLKLPKWSPLSTVYQPGLLSGVNVINGEASNAAGEKIPFTAVPFYSLGNRTPGALYQVWLDK